MYAGYMYPRITTLIAASLVLSSEACAWDWNFLSGWFGQAPPQDFPAEIEVPAPPEPEMVPPTAGTSYLWNRAAGGLWNTAAPTNWAPNTAYPTNQDDVAAFAPYPSLDQQDITAAASPVFNIGTLTLDVAAVGTSPSIPTLLLTNQFALDFNSSSGPALLQVLTTNGGQASYEINCDINLTSTVDIVQNSSFINFGNAALHVTGSISGGGGINYMGPQNAIFNFVGTNSYTGTTAVSGGAVQFQYAGVGIPGDLSISNTGAVLLQTANVLASTSNVTVTGPFAVFNCLNHSQSFHSLTQSGSIVDTGTAILTLSSATPWSLSSSSFFGNLTLSNGGTVSVANTTAGPSTIASSSIVTNALLTFNVAEVSSVDLITSNTTISIGNLKKTGLGTWQITGPGSYTATEVNQGTLVIEGSGVTMGSITVDSGATLSLPQSISFITPTLTNNGAVSLSSQQASGTYNINGNYVQGATGGLLINVANTHTSAVDRLNFTGTAMLNGTLTVDLDNEGIVVDQDQVTFLTASSVTGTFPTINTNFPAGLTFDVGYTADSVFLVFHGNFVPAFNFLQTTGYMNFAQPLFALNDEHNLQMVRRCAFVRSRMSASKESQLVGLLASADDTIPSKQIAVSRFRNNPEGKPLSIYAAPYVSRGKFKRMHDQNGFDYRAAGGLLGADYAFSQAGIGAQVGYEHLHAGVHEHWGRFDMNNLFGRLYGTFTPFKHVPFFIDASAGCGGEWYDIDRITALGTAHGKPRGWEWDAYLGLGYDRWIRNVRITPLLAVQSMGVSRKKYLEHGALTHNLEFHRYYTTSLRSDAGFSIGGKLVRRKITWLPEVRGYWQHEYLGHQKNLTVATPLADLTTSVTVIGLDKNYGIIGTEQRFLFADRWSLALDYDYQWSRHQYSNDFLVELAVYF